MTLTNEQIERLRDAAALLLDESIDGVHHSAAADAYQEESDPRVVAALCTEFLALRAEVERLKRPEVVAEAFADLCERDDVVRADALLAGRWQVSTLHRLSFIGSTLPEAFAKLQEARRGE